MILFKLVIKGWRYVFKYDDAFVTCFANWLPLLLNAVVMCLQRQSIGQLDSTQQQKLASGDSFKSAGHAPTARNYLGMDDSDEERENQSPGDGMDFTRMGRRSLYPQVSAFTVFALCLGQQEKLTNYMDFDRYFVRCCPDLNFCYTENR